MKTRRVLLLSLSAAAVVALGYWGSQEVVLHTLASPGINVRPFAAQMVTYSFRTGKKTLVEQYILARRSDGATARTGTLFGANGRTVSARRIDLPNGFVAMIVDSLRAKITGQKPAPNAAQLAAALENTPVDCVYRGQTLMGTAKMFGFPADEVAGPVMPAPDGGTERTVSWMLPDFGCQAVSFDLQERSPTTGQWEPVSEIRTVAFLPLEPAPAIFAGWDGYAEMKPSELASLLMKKAGENPASCTKCLAKLADADANYEQWHAALGQQ